MASQVTNYKCLSCTADLKFSAQTGKLECEYCGSSYTVEEIEAKMAEKNAQAEEAKVAAEQKEAADKAEGKHDYAKEAWLDEGMKAYKCPQCGAQIICEAITGSTSCPYCGSQTMVPGTFAGMQKPDYVIPFKQTKEAASKALEDFYKSKILLPSSFKNKNHISEIKGIYVPFWLYDASASGSCLYEGIKKKNFRRGDYDITQKLYYEVRRSGQDFFAFIPADGSKNMPDDLMDSIEPYDYNQLKEFSKAYLAGFLADKYDVTEEENRPRAETRARNTLSADLRNTVSGYDSIRTVNEDINVNLSEGRYAMLPVWLLSTRWEGKNFLFAMNGQTGKMVGNLPIDKMKCAMITFGTFIVTVGIAFGCIDGNDDAVMALKIIVPIIVSAIVAWALVAQMKTVELATSAGQYKSKPLELTMRDDIYLRTEESSRKIEKKNE